MTLPLMPKSTAVWLIENTTLTFEQISEFCGMHVLEVQGMADGEVSLGIMGASPIVSGQLSADEIARCENNPKAKLQLSERTKKLIESRSKKTSKYVPVAKRQDKPDAILWLLKNHPHLTEAQLVRLIGTTKNTIAAVRDKTHWNSQNLKPRDPVMLGLCKQSELNALAAVAASKNNDQTAK